MEDAEGANFVTDLADAAGNVILIELDTGRCRSRALPAWDIAGP